MGVGEAVGGGVAVGVDEGDGMEIASLAAASIVDSGAVTCLQDDTLNMISKDNRTFALLDMLCSLAT